MKITIGLFLALLSISAATPKAHAVNPPPDGGYGGNNTAEGSDALFNLSTGVWNSAVGFRALYRNATGIRNTAVGYQALYNNNGSFNISGQDNVAVGPLALFSNTTGSRNIAIGSFALHDNTTGSDNIAIGDHALWQLIGSGHTAVGDSFASGPDFVSLGRPPQFNGHGGLVRHGVQTATINAESDIFIGVDYGLHPGLTTQRVSIIAQDAILVGSDFVTPSVHIGARDSVFVTAVYGNPIAGSPVTVNSNGQLGVAPSSKRFKADIRPMEQASEAILALKPVTFRYKPEIDRGGTPQFGLVAEDVEKVNSDLVVRDKGGHAYSVRYEAVNAMLLNEFLKEHQKVEEQQATIAELKKAIARLEARDEQETAQIQKVTAQLEMSKSVPQTVVNDQ